MDTLRTEDKRCTKKSCKTMIPPPQPNERDYSTCENCRARDAVSKKRKREGNIAKGSGLQQVASVIAGGVRMGRTGQTGTGSGCHQGDGPIADTTVRVSIDAIIQ